MSIHKARQPARYLAPFSHHRPPPHLLILPPCCFCCCTMASRTNHTRRPDTTHLHRGASYLAACPTSVPPACLQCAQGRPTSLGACSKRRILRQRYAELMHHHHQDSLKTHMHVSLWMPDDGFLPLYQPSCYNKTDLSCGVNTQHAGRSGRYVGTGWNRGKNRRDSSR